MSDQERDGSPSDAPKSDADQTLMGVAPPRIDSALDSRPHSPVYVRSGTSVSDLEPVSLPRFAAPSPSRLSSTVSEPSAAGEPSTLRAREQLATRLHSVRARPVLSMVLLPVLCSLSLLALTGHRSRRAPEPESSRVATAPAAASSVSAAGETATGSNATELEGRPSSAASARELLLLADAHDQQKRSAAHALREQLAAEPASGKESAIQTQLLRLSADPLTAPDALAAMAALDPPIGADLLYEVWTASTVRSDTTDLARALLYSADVRSKASSALSVALDLRVAETCEQYEAVLPKALTDGDRRAAHLLAKLNAKHGCGAKKNEDCYACLRAKKDELSATISAVKSRTAPSFATQ